MILKYLKEHMFLFIFNGLSFVFGLIALILYTTNGITEFNPNLSLNVILGLSLGLAFIVVSLILPKLRITLYLPFLMFLYGFLEYLVSQDTYIANIFVGIDTTGISSTFVMICLFSALSFILPIFTFFFEKREKEDVKVEIKEAENQ